MQPDEEPMRVLVIGDVGVGQTLAMALAIEKIRQAGIAVSVIARQELEGKSRELLEHEVFLSEINLAMPNLDFPDLIEELKQEHKARSRITDLTYDCGYTTYTHSPPVNPPKHSKKSKRGHNKALDRVFGKPGYC